MGTCTARQAIRAMSDGTPWMLISVPGAEGDPKNTPQLIQESYQQLNRKVDGKGYAYVFKQVDITKDYPILELRVGTLDSLMSLSDELQKHDTFAESTVTKIRRQLMELGAKGAEEAKLADGTPVSNFLKTWRWVKKQYPAN